MDQKSTGIGKLKEIVLLLLFSTITSLGGYCAKKKYAVSTIDSTVYTIYLGSFSGIQYIEMVNQKEQYSIVYELNKRKNFFINKLDKKGVWIEQYNAVVDSNHQFYVAKNAKYIRLSQHIDSSQIKTINEGELNLLNKIIYQYNKERNKVYSNINYKVIFFFHPKSDAEILGSVPK